MRSIYCLYDRIALTFIGVLMTERADAPAIRIFHDVLSAKESAPGQHPNDYDLLCLGTISDDAVVTPLSVPRVVATGGAWLAAQQQPSVPFSVEQ